MPGKDQYTKLLLHCDGTDASTTFTDSELEPIKTVTANGNAQLDTAQKKFGTASGLFDGTGDYLSIPDHADWDFGTGDFTIDFWVRYSSVTTLYLSRRIKGGSGNWNDFYYNGTNIIIYINDSAVITTAWTPSANTWYHVEYGRSGTNVRVFIDGVQQGSTGTSSANIVGTDEFNFGWDAAAGSLNGWLYEIRISKGIARHTANFTPNTVSYGSVTHANAFFEDYKPG